MPALRSKFRRWILRTWLAALSVCAVAAAGGGSSLRQAVRLDDEWKTFLGNPAGAETKEFDDHAWKPVSVPHNWEDYQGYHQKSHGNLHGTAWYRRAFVPDVLLAGKRLFVEFAGVGSYATVWLNGHPVGGHKGGRTGFTIDLSEHVVFGQTNWLAVRADHPEKLNDLPYICGGCWGTPNTEGSQPFGIFRPVRLLATEAVRVIPFGVQVWTPEISESRAVVEIKTEVNNHDSTPRQVSVRSEILAAAGAVIARVESQAVTLAPGELHTFDQTSPALAKPHLWSLDDPYLHRVRTTVLEEGRPVDALDTRFGMRWISWPIANEESGVSARTIDPAKLAELPGPTNNNFTVIAEGRGTNGLQIVPQGVEVFVPEC